MRIGVPTEIKNHEYRVAITPAGVHQLGGWVREWLRFFEGFDGFVVQELDA